MDKGGHALSKESPWLRHIQDLNGRVWTLRNEILTIVPRKTSTVPATITLISCRYGEMLEKDKGDPMYLGVSNPTSYLLCDKDGEQPVLQLKAGDIMSLYNEKGAVKPFVFYHQKIGTTSSFESAAFPGWFIAACSNGSCPLFLSQEQGKTHVTDFQMNSI